MDVTAPMKINWTTVGEESVPVERRPEILGLVDTFEWHELPIESAPACPGLAIKAAIKECRIPRVSRVAWNAVLDDRYGLYGVEGNYLNGRAIIVLLDLGSEIRPLAGLFWPKDEDRRTKTEEEAPADDDREVLTISHSHAEGTLLEGDPRPHHKLLRPYGWKWSPRVGWYIRNSRDRDANRSKVQGTVEAMEGAGFRVEVQVDNERRPLTERLADQDERADRRDERRTERIERLDAEADQRFDAAKQTMDLIPFGQPILVGHHSERRHRRDLERIDTNMGKGVEAHREAERLRSVQTKRARTSDPRYLRNRIEECEAEARRCDRLGRAEKAKGYREDAAEWKRLLAELGKTVNLLGPDDVKVGDICRRRRGGKVYVTRVNKKTVSGEYETMRGIPQRVPYEELAEVIGNVDDDEAKIA